MLCGCTLTQLLRNMLIFLLFTENYFLSLKILSLALFLIYIYFPQNTVASYSFFNPETHFNTRWPDFPTKGKHLPSSSMVCLYYLKHCNRCTRYSNSLHDLLIYAAAATKRGNGTCSTCVCR